jgi:allantoate deiminase
VRLPFAIETIAFAEEEGCRFGAALLGSRAVAGTFDQRVLNRTDEAGIPMGEAMSRFGLNPSKIGRAAKEPNEVLGYVELHIEQGPVLEKEGLSVGCVDSINGAARYEIHLTGMAGHAGTVPMTMRRDAAVGAAECIVAVERRCQHESDLVGTMGMIEVQPGAVNVIPGKARLTLDIRAPKDESRHRAEADLLATFERIATQRRLGIVIEKLYEARTVRCAPWLMHQIDSAMEFEGLTPYRLSSGAGHDAMAMADLSDVGMIFVRCKSGISHNPAETITAADAEAATRVMLHFIRSFKHIPSAMNRNGA